MCKKGCLGRKYPDIGWNFNSLPNPSEQLSEEEDQSEGDGEASGIFFRPQVYEMVGISLVEVLKLKAGKYNVWVCERVQKC